MTKEPLRILVVGTGSAGTRHLENLLSLGAEVAAFSYRPDRRDLLSDRYGIRVFSSLEQALDSPQDAVVISNSTDRHVETALAAARRGLHMFIEKPLSNRIDGIEELAGLAAAQSLVVEIGCTMRFHPNLIRIRELLAEGAIGRIYSARACVGQYLPDWRPGQDYRLSYSARAKLGGGVLFDLVHELDFLHWWFGHI